MTELVECETCEWWSTSFADWWEHVTVEKHVAVVYGVET